MGHYQEIKLECIHIVELPDGGDREQMGKEENR